MNPQEQPYPPEEEITTFSIRVSRAVSQEHSDDTWAIHCPEWKYHTHSTDPAKAVAGLIEEIQAHNENVYRPELERKLFNALIGEVTGKLPPRKRRRPTLVPDDGTRTPRVGLWQAPQ
jgi:hypothetical protein